MTATATADCYSALRVSARTQTSAIDNYADEHSVEPFRRLPDTGPTGPTESSSVWMQDILWQRVSLRAMRPSFQSVKLFTTLKQKATTTTIVLLCSHNGLNIVGDTFRADFAQICAGPTAETESQNCHCRLRRQIYISRLRAFVS